MRRQGKARVKKKKIMPHRMMSAEKKINDRSENWDKSSTRGILSSVSTEPVLCLRLPYIFISNPELDIKLPQTEFAADEDW